MAQRLVHTSDLIRRERASPRNANEVSKIFGGVTADDVLVLPRSLAEMRRGPRRLETR